MKLTFIGFCAIALLLSTGCSSTKATAKSGSTDAKGAIASQEEQKLPPVAEAPRRPTWGSNISPYFN